MSLPGPVVPVVPYLGVFAVYAGDDWRIQLRLWEDAAKTIPADLSGYTGWAGAWRANRKAEESLPMIVSVSGNVLTLGMAAATTRQMEYTRYGVFDVQAVHPQKGARTFGTGDTELTRDVKR